MVILIGIFVLGSVGLVLWWGTRHNLPNSMTGVMSAGIGVCGVSASVAAAPVVQAKSIEIAYTIGTILLFGGGLSLGTLGEATGKDISPPPMPSAFVGYSLYPYRTLSRVGTGERITELTIDERLSAERAKQPGSSSTSTARATFTGWDATSGARHFIFRPRSSISGTAIT